MYLNCKFEKDVTNYVQIYFLINISMYGSVEEVDKCITHRLIEHFAYLDASETEQISAYLREFF